MTKRSMFRDALSSVAALALSVGLSAPASAAVDVDADVVHLRKDCLEGGNEIDNCFTDLDTLNDWIWNTRNPQPSAQSPLLVRIGPGVFNGSFSCNDSGYVTLHGSGMGDTVIEDGSTPVSSVDCVNLNFNDLTLRNTGNVFGVKNLGGSTFWHNIEIEGIGYAWFDSPTGSCSAGGPGEHYWFNSRITVTTEGNSNTAYYNSCDVSWFFGSEIVAVGSEGQVSPLRVPGGEAHVYGSVIRALTDGAVTVSSMTAAHASGDGEIHIHGTGIDVISDAANDVVALKVTDAGRIHANQASYVMETGAGASKTRILDEGGTVTAPYLWGEGTNPPDVTSVTGKDMAVITNTSDGHPHTVVYDEACGSNWFDTVTGNCF